MKKMSLFLLCCIFFMACEQDQEIHNETIQETVDVKINLNFDIELVTENARLQPVIDELYLFAGEEYRFVLSKEDIKNGTFQAVLPFDPEEINRWDKMMFTLTSRDLDFGQYGNLSFHQTNFNWGTKPHINKFAQVKDNREWFGGQTLVDFSTNMEVNITIDRIPSLITVEFHPDFLQHQEDEYFMFETITGTRIETLCYGFWGTDDSEFPPSYSADGTNYTLTNFSFIEGRPLAQFWIDPQYNMNRMILRITSNNGTVLQKDLAEYLPNRTILPNKHYKFYIKKVTASGGFNLQITEPDEDVIILE